MVEGIDMELISLLATIFFSINSFGADNLSVKDPLFSKQWALKNNGQVILKDISDLERIRVQGIAGSDIHWANTSDMVTPKKDLIVAVLDSGVDIDHPDLKGRIWYNENLCTNAPNAKNLPCNGFNFLDGNTDVSDDVGHGTHVAGVIAANRNNIGVAGAADPRIKIMPVKVLNSKVNGFVYNGKLITDVIADAMIFAIKNGAEVINLSLGWPKLIDTPKVRQAFQLAEDKNVIVIAASGNNSKDLPTFPCAYESVICVGAIDNRGELSDFSNFGSKVDIVAPGEYIVSTIPRNLESRVLRIANYDVKRGSSQAAPFVTAAVATLKLLNPEMSNDKVRSLLFKSSNKIPNIKGDHFVKFGSLDMQNLLSLAQKNEDNAFLNPQVKAITEVKYRISDRQFSFSLPLKNLSDTEYNGKVCLDSASSAIDLDQKCFEVKNVQGHWLTTLNVTGKVVELEADSHVKISIQIDDKIFQLGLVFSRDLNADTELKSIPVVGGSFNDMAFINGERKLSKMTRVIDKFHRINYPEYFYLERAKQTLASTVVSLLTKENDSYIVKSISLPLVNKVLSIHRQDINMDGNVDIFIYALSAKRDELLFFTFDKNLNPLFGKYSKWTMPLSTFEGLPIDGGVEKFEWLKINHPQLGNIVVPSLYKSYAMPEADNSKNILDRVVTATNHQFYLNPVRQAADDSMKIELRVVDSVALMKKMKKDFNLYDDQCITLLSPFPQTDEQSKTGVVHSLAVEDNGSEKTFLELTLSPDEIKVHPLTSVMGLETALIFPIVNLQNGMVTNQSIFTSLLNRSNAEFLLKTDQGISGPLVLKQQWENPVIGLTGAFNLNGEQKLLVENRSTITFVANSNTRFDLPIYRDSSFPGQNFSELLIPTIVDGKPGVFINSTLIYGERLYSMIGDDSGLVRPLRLSIDIPNGCVPLNPEIFIDKANANYLFLCAGQNNDATLKYLPMSQD